MEPETEKILSTLQSQITEVRKQLLDILEVAFREHPKWVFVRSRVLRALGKSGLEGVLESALRQINKRTGADHEQENNRT